MTPFHFHRARAVFDATRAARRGAEQRAGQVWNDTVLRRLHDNKLRPLADEENSFAGALERYDLAVHYALQELENT